MPAFKTRPANPRRQRGLSLVEILVGVLIGMIGVVLIFQVLAVAEQRKRSTVQGGAAQTAGAVALYTLERELQVAGLGFGTAHYGQLGCNVRVYDASRPTDSDAGKLDFKLVPIQIIDGAGDAPDTIAVFWSNPTRFISSGAVLKGWTSVPSGSPPAGTITLDGGRAGFDWGDILLLTTNPTPGAAKGPTETPGLGTPPATGQLQQCALVQVSARPGDQADGTTLGVDQTVLYQDDWQSPKPTGFPASYWPPVAALKTAADAPRFNKPGGGWPDNITTDKGVVLDLGKQPRRSEYSIVGDRIQFVETFANSPGGEVASGVIDMQAEYGIDTNNDDMIDKSEWTITAPTGEVPTIADQPCMDKPAKSWRCVRAIRVALLARSDQFDPSACSPNPQWTSGTKVPGTLTPKDFKMSNLDGTADSFGSPCGASASPNDWRRYRYGVYETVIPLRNMIWGTAP
jgi:type IV pilus assembly protein PilW